MSHCWAKASALFPSIQIFYMQMKTAKLKWDCARHVCRMNQDRWARIISDWFPSDGHRSSRPKRRCKDNLDRFQSNWKHFAATRDKDIMLLKYPWKCPMIIQEMKTFRKLNRNQTVMIWRQCKMLIAHPIAKSVMKPFVSWGLGNSANGKSAITDDDIRFVAATTT